MWRVTKLADVERHPCLPEDGVHLPELLTFGGVGQVDCRSSIEHLADERATLGSAHRAQARTTGIGLGRPASPIHPVVGW